MCVSLCAGVVQEPSRQVPPAAEAAAAATAAAAGQDAEGEEAERGQHGRRRRERGREREPAAREEPLDSDDADGRSDRRCRARHHATVSLRGVRGIGRERDRAFFSFSLPSSSSFGLELIPG